MTVILDLIDSARLAAIDASEMIANAAALASEHDHPFARECRRRAGRAQDAVGLLLQELSELAGEPRMPNVVEACRG